MNHYLWPIMLMKNFLTYTTNYTQKKNGIIPNQLLRIQQAQQMHKNTISCTIILQCLYYIRLLKLFFKLCLEYKLNKKYTFVSSYFMSMIHAIIPSSQLPRNGGEYIFSSYIVRDAHLWSLYCTFCSFKVFLHFFKAFSNKNALKCIRSFSYTHFA